VQVVLASVVVLPVVVAEERLAWARPFVASAAACSQASTEV
jgi:hypothetical protein